METEYKLCKRGHVRSPDNVTSNGSCKECQKIFNKITCNKPESKERKRQYDMKLRQTEEHKAYKRKQAKTEHNKELAKLRAKKPKAQENIKIYRRLESTRKRALELRQREEVSKREKAYESQRMETLSDNYVAHMMRLPVKQCTAELITLKRQQLLFKREIKAMKEAIG